MLVYDITNEKSFDNIKNWIRNIEEVKYFSFVNLSSFLFVSACRNVLHLSCVDFCAFSFGIDLLQRAKENAQL